METDTEQDSPQWPYLVTDCKTCGTRKKGDERFKREPELRSGLEALGKDTQTEGLNRLGDQGAAGRWCRYHHSSPWESVGFRSSGGSKREEVDETNWKQNWRDLVWTAWEKEGETCIQDSALFLVEAPASPPRCHLASATMGPRPSKPWLSPGRGRWTSDNSAGRRIDPGMG